jgi:hypothetical protein
MHFPKLKKKKKKKFGNKRKAESFLLVFVCLFACLFSNDERHSKMIIFSHLISKDTHTHTHTHTHKRSKQTHKQAFYKCPLHDFP